MLVVMHMFGDCAQILHAFGKLAHEGSRGQELLDSPLIPSLRGQLCGASTVGTPPALTITRPLLIYHLAVPHPGHYKLARLGVVDDVALRLPVTFVAHLLEAGHIDYSESVTSPPVAVQPHARYINWVLQMSRPRRVRR